MVDVRAWDVIVKGLSEEKVGYVFGLPGHPDALYDSLYDSDVEPVLVRHEASGAFMAYAYGKMRRSPGVCFASPGPGVSNLVPGVLEAWSGCVPMLALGGSAALSHEGEGAFQEAPQMEVFRGITKWGFRVPRADRASWATRRAFTLAVNGKPGPVYLEVPFDVGQEKTKETRYTPPIPFTRMRPDSGGAEARRGAAARRREAGNRRRWRCALQWLLSGARQVSRALRGTRPYYAERTRRHPRGPPALPWAGRTLQDDGSAEMRTSRRTSSSHSAVRTRSSRPRGGATTRKAQRSCRWTSTPTSSGATSRPP